MNEARGGERRAADFAGPWWQTRFFERLPRADAIGLSIRHLMPLCPTASRPAVNRIFVWHPARTEKIITRQIDHAFADHDGLGLPIPEECFHSLFPARQSMSSAHTQVIDCDASCLELFLQVR
jgi:hypothetical protein